MYVRTYVCMYICMYVLNAFIPCMYVRTYVLYVHNMYALNVYNVITLLAISCVCCSARYCWNQGRSCWFPDTGWHYVECTTAAISVNTWIELVSQSYNEQQ